MEGCRSVGLGAVGKTDHGASMLRKIGRFQLTGQLSSGCGFSPFKDTVSRRKSFVMKFK